MGEVAEGECGWLEKGRGGWGSGHGGRRSWWCRRVEDGRKEASRYECDEIKRTEVMEGG